MKKNLNVGLLLLRLSTGGLLIFHGIAKVKNSIQGVKTTFEGIGVPSVLAYTVYITEILAPILLIIGFRTRVGALLVAAMMLVIMFLVQPDGLNTLSKTGAWALELQGLFFFGAMALFFTGAGKYAVSTKNKWD